MARARRGDAASKVKAEVRKAVREALTEIARDLVATIRDLINVKVQYIGSHVIRSEPGEPPRREEGSLWRSFGYKVRANAATLEGVTIFSTSMVSFWLEYGTDNIEPRPHWEPALDELGNPYEELRRRVAAKLRARRITVKGNLPGPGVPRYGIRGIT